MRSDDTPSTRLTDDERRRFDDLAHRFDTTPSAGSWRLRVAGWVWSCIAVVALVASVVALGTVPVLVSFAGYLVAVAALHEAGAHGRSTRSWARCRAALGLAEPT
jgi:hypothetical protein